MQVNDPSQCPAVVAALKKRSQLGVQRDEVAEQLKAAVAQERAADFDPQKGAAEALLGMGKPHEPAADIETRLRVLDRAIELQDAAVRKALYDAGQAECIRLKSVYKSRVDGLAKALRDVQKAEDALDSLTAEAERAGICWHQCWPPLPFVYARRDGYNPTQVQVWLDRYEHMSL